MLLNNSSQRSQCIVYRRGVREGSGNVWVELHNRWRLSESRSESVRPAAAEVVLGKDLVVIDARGIRPKTLTTREGELDVLDRVAGIGDFAEVMEHSVKFESFGVSFRVLDLPELIRAKRAAGRPKDIAQLPELEALAALRKSR